MPYDFFQNLTVILSSFFFVDIGPFTIIKSVFPFPSLDHLFPTTLSTPTVFVLFCFFCILQVILTSEDVDLGTAYGKDHAISAFLCLGYSIQSDLI